jgi:hypothetical protein
MFDPESKFEKFLRRVLPIFEIKLQQWRRCPQSVPEILKWRRCPQSVPQI